MQKTVQADPMIAQAFRDTMIDFINKKSVLNYDGPLDLQFQVFKIERHQAAITDLTQNSNVRVIQTFETTEDELREAFNNMKKKNPAHIIKQF
jgi:hypothetical protein